MKILVCSLTYPLPNGVTVSINTAMDGFIKKGHQMMIVSPDYKVGSARKDHYPVKSSAIARGVGVILGKEERTFGIGSRNEIKKIDANFKPDAYWLHSLTWGRNAFEAHMFSSSKPKVLFYHTMVEEYGRLYAGKIGAYTMRDRSKRVCNKMDAIMTPSSAMKSKLESYGVNKPIQIIPTGIDSCLNPFSKKEIQKKFKIPPGFKILLYVGRVSKEKNLRVLLDAVKNLKKSDYKAVLLIVGPGDIEDLSKEVQKMDINDRVFLTGGLTKQETVRIYGGCDAFVFSSKTETQGLVIGEAMHAGIPVIALTSPIQEEVYPENFAIVVKKENEFSDKIIRVFENEKMTKEMTKRAKKFVKENFSKKLMIERQINLFEKLIQ